MEIFFSIVSLASLVFCTGIITDRVIFMNSMKMISVGMTGQEIQEISGLKITIIKISGKTYYGQVQSKLSIFKYRLVFLNGKLISKIRD